MNINNIDDYLWMLCHLVNIKSDFLIVNTDLEKCISHTELVNIERYIKT